MEVLSHDELLQAGSWDQLVGLPYWLSSEWLDVLAKAGAPKTRYLAFYRDEKKIGVSLLQTLPVLGMKLGENVRPQMASIVFGAVLEQFGQALYSADGGMYFLEGEQPSELIRKARNSLAQRSPSSCYLLKDVHVATPVRGWSQLTALPEMVMSIPTEWSSFGDYLEALPSKYRKRAKRARKKFEGLTTRLLNAEEGIQYRDSIDRLYRELVERSPFVPYQVPPGYVTKLKELAPERVELRGYFDQDELVGFSTFLVGGAESIAHYCAIDPSHNPTHQLYLNLLLDLLQASIERGVAMIHYGRTATTIKSSVGAVPLRTYSFASHDGCIRNQLLTVLNNRVLANAEEELIQRPLER